MSSILKGLNEGMADDFMAMAKARGMNARVAGTPEQERERTNQMLAQRATDREQQAIQSAANDAKILPQLKAEYDEVFKKYNSLGGRNWQYADREQNLTSAEREARSLEPKLNDLSRRIHAATKQGVAEGRVLHRDLKSWTDDAKSQGLSVIEPQDDVEWTHHATDKTGKIHGKFVTTNVPQNSRGFIHKQGVAEADKHSFVGKIQRGHELKKKVDSTFKDIGDAQKQGDHPSASKAFRKHERYANLERPGTWTKVDEEGVAESPEKDMSKEVKAMATGKCPHCHGPVQKKEHPTLTQYHCAKCGIRASKDKQGVAEEQLDELSPQTLASYKKKAGADATAADKRGDYKRGDKRMSGIIKATKKEFDNNAKGVAEEQQAKTTYTDVKKLVDQLDSTAKQRVVAALKKSLGSTMEEGSMGTAISQPPGSTVSAGQRFYKPRHVPNQDEIQKQGMAEGDHSPMTQDAIKADKIRSLKNLISIYKEKGRQLKVQELELELKKLQGVEEAELDENCWKGYHKEGNKELFGKTVPNCVKNEDAAEEQHSCPHCGGELVSEELMNEKKDACYYKVKSRYKVWPSAYASGALVKCRKSHGNWGNGGKKNESSILEGIERADENLHQWFKEKWVRFGPDGKIRGDCARGDDSEGKPKCLPQSKAQSLGKKGRASAAARKRREDPNPERSGKAINVNTKKK